MSLPLSGLDGKVGVTEIIGDAETFISGAAYDSRRVRPGMLFVAIKGQADDGRRYLDKAIQAGAAAIMVEGPLEECLPVPAVLVRDARKALAYVSAQLYGYPAEKLITLGITGTKGKTTTSFLIKSILEAAGIKTGLMGTIKIIYGDKEIDAEITTPESLDIQMHLAGMVEAGMSAAIIEVSSHALALSRVAGCDFDIGVFTNLGRDHLDFHGDTDSYMSAKKLLFDEYLTGRMLPGGPAAVINLDDENGPDLVKSISGKVWTYGLNQDSDLTVWETKNGKFSLSAMLEHPGGRFQIHTTLMGKVNLYNIMAASCAALAMGIDPERIAAGLESAGGIPGRLERVGSNDQYLVLVDYAHTAEALVETLSSVKNMGSGRLITVFGCGGDRDRSKRPEMGRAAGTYSDLAITTSDNPRTEHPEDIIAEIEPGLQNLNLIKWEPGEQNGDFPKRSYAVVADRRKAIKLAVRLMQPGDILVVAGKGHEDYQIIGTEKVHLDDREEALAALSLEGKA